MVVLLWQEWCHTNSFSICSANCWVLVGDVDFSQVMPLASGSRTKKMQLGGKTSWSVDGVDGLYIILNDMRLKQEYLWISWPNCVKHLLKVGQLDMCWGPLPEMQICITYDSWHLDISSRSDLRWGPDPVVCRVITPLIGVNFSQLPIYKAIYKAIYRVYKSMYNCSRDPSCSTVKSLRWQETGDTQDAMWSCSQSIGLISVKPRMFHGFLCMYAMISYDFLIFGSQKLPPTTTLQVF